MKALVLCAGLGTRLRPFTLTTAKHLIPVANKPVLFHVVEALRDVGVADLGVVVSRESRPSIEEALGDGAALGVRATYLEQPQPRGLAHATACGREFIGGEPFLLYLGDTLLPEGLAGLVGAFTPGVTAALMLKPVEDPRGYGIAVVDGGRVTQLVEKPREPLSNLAIAGAYAFTPEIFASIEGLEPSWRGEYEITDAIQDLIERGREVRAVSSSGWWKDTGEPEDLIDANTAMLERLENGVHGQVDGRSRLEGTVVIARSARVIGSVIRGPVIVGEGAVIEDADVGPHVSVGDHARIAHCRLSESIVMRDAVVAGLARPLARCVIGRKAEVTGGEATRLIVGDHSRVGIER